MRPKKRFEQQSWKKVVTTILMLTTEIENGVSGFFLKIFDGGTQNFWSPSRTMETNSDGGGGLMKKIRLKPKLPT